jgi:hypothetical protein
VGVTRQPWNVAPLEPAAAGVRPGKTYPVATPDRIALL